MKTQVEDHYRAAWSWVANRVDAAARKVFPTFRIQLRAPEGARKEGIPASSICPSTIRKRSTVQ